MWSVRILGFLREGTRRFNDIRREYDVNPKILAESLKQLKKAGLVSTILLPKPNPQGYEGYTITTRGMSVLELARQIEEE
jgi:DNA-binding HxlR family transcriptional regulator